jgi:hypothetical protein
MADTAATDRPYPDAAALLDDLTRLLDSFPLEPDDWQKLLDHARENGIEGLGTRRQSA